MKHDERISLFSHCPRCCRSYERSDLKMIDTTGYSTSYHALCRSCQHALIISVKKDAHGLTCAGVFTDCSFEDALRFKHAEAISADDVLEAHLALQLDNFIRIG